MEQYKNVEYALYHYRARIAALDALNRELQLVQSSTDVKAQSYEQHFSSAGNISNPLEQRVLKIESIERKIKFLERWTIPITILIKDLNSSDGKGDDLLNVLQLVYFNGVPVANVAIKLNISRQGLYKLKYKLVSIACEYLGLYKFG